MTSVLKIRLIGKDRSGKRKVGTVIGKFGGYTGLRDEPRLTEEERTFVDKMERMSDPEEILRMASANPDLFSRVISKGYVDFGTANRVWIPKIYGKKVPEKVDKLEVILPTGRTIRVPVKKVTSYSRGSLQIILEESPSQAAGFGVDSGEFAYAVSSALAELNKEKKKLRRNKRKKKREK